MRGRGLGPAPSELGPVRGRTDDRVVEGSVRRGPSSVRGGPSLVSRGARVSTVRSRAWSAPDQAWSAPDQARSSWIVYLPPRGRMLGPRETKHANAWCSVDDALMPSAVAGGPSSVLSNRLPATAGSCARSAGDQACESWCSVHDRVVPSPVAGVPSLVLRKRLPTPAWSCARSVDDEPWVKLTLSKITPAGAGEAAEFAAQRASSPSHLRTLSQKAHLSFLKALSVDAVTSRASCVSFVTS